MTYTKEQVEAALVYAENPVLITNMGCSCGPQLARQKDALLILAAALREETVHADSLGKSLILMSESRDFEFSRAEKMKDPVGVLSRMDCLCATVDNVPHYAGCPVGEALKVLGR